MVPISISQEISGMGVDCYKQKDRRTGRHDEYSLFVIAVLSTFLFLLFSYAVLLLDVFICFYVFVLDSFVLSRNVRKIIHNLLVNG